MAPGRDGRPIRAARRARARGAHAGRERMEVEVLIAAVSSLMVMVPLWRITRRTGRDPWLSLLFLGTPPLGTLLFVAILAFGRWPNASRPVAPAPLPSAGPAPSADPAASADPARGA